MSNLKVDLTAVPAWIESHQAHDAPPLEGMSDNFEMGISVQQRQPMTPRSRNNPQVVVRNRASLLKQ